jgi:CDP-glycerol glycerophosphotransferase (TagB/SpsB family)
MLLQSRKQVKHDLSHMFEELAQKNYTVAELLTLSQNADDRRIAVRYRYIAALLALNERNIIHINPSATNALILQSLQANRPALANPFTHMMHVYHLSWFGYKEIDEKGFSLFCEAGDVLMGASHA